MPAQTPEDYTGELHPIGIRLDEDSTEVSCAGCEFHEESGLGLGPSASQLAAYHAMVTGHSVFERHVVVTVIRECA